MQLRLFDRPRFGWLRERLCVRAMAEHVREDGFWSVPQTSTEVHIRDEQAVELHAVKLGNRFNSIANHSQSLHLVLNLTFSDHHPAFDKLMR